MRQVLVIGSCGSLSGLVHKGRGLDLRSFGNATIRRATLIEWSDSDQKWFIRWEGRCQNHVWNLPTLDCLKAKDHVTVSSVGGIFRVGWTDTGYVQGTLAADGRLLFDEYDQAVLVEVAVIQSLQRDGLYERETPASTQPLLA